MYAVPAAPGRVRLLFHSLLPVSGMPWVFRVLKLLPRWVDHVRGTSQVLAGDSALLHAQVRLTWAPVVPEMLRMPFPCACRPCCITTALSLPLT